MNIGNPNFNNYEYFENNSQTSPSVTMTFYTNRVARWMMTSPSSPQNITLESLGEKSAGVGVDLSTSLKVGVQGSFNNGMTTAPGAELKGTLTQKVMNNGGNSDLFNTNSSLSAESSLQSVGISSKKILSSLGIKLKTEAYSYFSFSNKSEPPSVGAAQNESVFSFKLLYLKIQYSTSSSGAKEFKIGVTSDPGVEYKKTNRTKETLTSITTESKYHY